MLPKVARQGSTRLLETADAIVGQADPHVLFTGLVWDKLTVAAAFNGPLNGKSVLCLGLGIGTSVRQMLHLYPKVRITAVDLDPSLPGLAHDHFFLPRTRYQFVASDARRFIEGDDSRWDVIIDDVYAAGKTITRPASCRGAYFDLLRKRLKPGGTLVLNTICEKPLEPFNRAATAWALEKFRHVHAAFDTRCDNAVLTASNRNEAKPWMNRPEFRKLPRHEKARLQEVAFHPLH